MRSLFPVIFAITLIVVFGIVQLLFLKFLNREWWQKRWVRLAAWMLPASGMVSVVLWGYGEYSRIDWLAYPGAIIAVLAFILEVALTISLPVSGLIHLVNRVFDWLGKKRRPAESTAVDRHRRLILRTGAAAVPLATLAAGGVGVLSALGGARVYLKPLHIENLPADLDGLRILHVTDVHLRHYVGLDDLAAVLTDAQSYRPDITLVTGDVADDLKVLPDALRIIGELNSPLGAYGCLGNHEYFRGLSQVIRTFEHSPVPLFVNAGTRIQRGNTSIFIGGIDDPMLLRVRNYDVFISDIDEALGDSGEDDFVILMSHRPNAFDYAADRNVRLVLSGHTHGGQVGMSGRSLFESLWPERYLWGHYRMKQSHLYTSSGVGHWFPFRLGCPAEAPVIELRRG